MAYPVTRQGRSLLQRRLIVFLVFVLFRTFPLLTLISSWITAFKLSPNLRKMTKVEDPKKLKEAEIDKLEKILVFAAKSEATAAQA